MINNSILKPYIDRAVNNLIVINKVLALYYDYSNKTLVFNIVVSDKLDEDEVEEARVAQTEVLSDFPDREIEIFIINQYLMSNDGDTVSKIKGELIYKRDKMTEEVKGYKLIFNEKAQFEDV